MKSRRFILAPFEREEFANPYEDLMLMYHASSVRLRAGSLSEVRCLVNPYFAYFAIDPLPLTVGPAYRGSLMRLGSGASLWARRLFSRGRAGKRQTIPLRLSL